ncbi:hypothetical protein Tco_0458260 [Tanacetum coccineum]
MALKTWSKQKYRGLDAEIEKARVEADLWKKEGSDELVSGLKVNLSKSKLYCIDIEMEEIEDYARSLGVWNVVVGNFVFRTSNWEQHGEIENWNIMVDKFKSKLSDWKANMISFGGRLTNVVAYRSSGGGDFENEALGEKVIKILYGAGGGLLEENISFAGNSVRGNIVKVYRDLGDGKAILF